jgi:predicted PurR-regulated permease PerM
MALVPVYHPFIGALVVIFCSWMYKSESSTILLLILCLVYLLLSNMIFSLSYSRISMPSLITNLSVILGIYSFGGLGVVYGPIIVTILRGIIT